MGCGDSAWVVRGKLIDGPFSGPFAVCCLQGCGCQGLRGECGRQLDLVPTFHHNLHDAEADLFMDRMSS